MKHDVCARWSCVLWAFGAYSTLCSVLGANRPPMAHRDAAAPPAVSRMSSLEGISATAQQLCESVVNHH